MTGAAATKISDPSDFMLYLFPMVSPFGLGCLFSDPTGFILAGSVF